MKTLSKAITCIGTISLAGALCFAAAPANAATIHFKNNDNVDQWTSTLTTTGTGQCQNVGTITLNGNDQSTTTCSGTLTITKLNVCDISGEKTVCHDETNYPAITQFINSAKATTPDQKNLLITVNADTTPSLISFKTDY